VWPDELGKGFQDYVKLKLEHVVYDFMCTYVRRIKPDTRWKKILKMNAGNPFICHFTPSDIAYVLAIIKNGQEMWDQAKNPSTSPENKLKPLYSAGEGRKRESGIDSDIHRSFFRVFIKFGSTVLYKKWVLTPVNLPKALSNTKEYSEAGFPGCVGSSDCTHIVTDRCEYSLKNNHLGAKNSLMTRTFNLTCNHRHRILHTTYGGPGRWNDQTMVRLDSFISGICDGIVIDDVSFELFTHDRKSHLI
jgi:hypothetical protein